MELNKNIIDEVINSLKESPIFNISLTSKELFHSNFLAWLCEQFPEEMGTVFSQFINRKDGDLAIARNEKIKREEKNIDLQFSLKNGQHIIIENKVKSLPYLKQLEDYTRKYSDKAKYSYILLSLSKPTHLFREIDDKIEVKINDSTYYWKYMSYEFLSKLLRIELIEKKSNKNQYITHIISDYISLIENLCKINALTNVNEKDKFDIYENYIYKSFGDDSIRLGDYYIKKISENLAVKILLKVKKIVKENNLVEVGAVGYNIKPEKEKEYVNVNSSIVKGFNGEVRLYYRINKRVTISIELSKTYYRKMLHVKNSFKGEKKEVIKYSNFYHPDEKAQKVNNELHWFSFDHIPREKKDKYNPKNDFNRFWDTRYKQCKLNSQNTFGDIIGYFIEDFSYAITIKNDLLKSFSDYETS